MFIGNKVAEKSKVGQNLAQFQISFKILKGNLKLGVILANFTFFGDLITNEDLEETYRTLYFLESPLYVRYGENTENTPN